ncbi:MAG: DUF5011 domain-containing protein, partial [Gammaproteobacteria bacterium]|nr:DUF5011 domain-containing protein [Gammaproteobacteria bacterium]
MKRIRGLYLVFFAAIMLVVVNSCGVPDPVVPTATVEPVDASTINNTDSIVISFSASMSPGSLTLSGDMASESDYGAWLRNSQTNDTLIIGPSAAGVWTTGSHTLIVDVLGTSGVPVSTLTLHYTVLPTAVVRPADTATIIGSDLIFIFFNAAMEPSTLILSGDMAAESNGGTWSTSSNINDTLVIRPGGVWSGNTSTLIIDVGSVEGASLSTLTLNYTVDTTVPAAIVLPADTAAINVSTPIVITFTLEMDPLTLVLSGAMAAMGTNNVWSTISNPNDKLTISPSGAWAGGEHTLIIDVNAINVVPLSTTTLNYTVDDALPTAFVSPATGSSINSEQLIIIDFNKSMDIDTLTASGTLWEDISDGGVWSTATVTNDTLTISPVDLWLEGPDDLTLTLDIVDLVGNSLTIPTQYYTVDTTNPVIALLGSDPVNIELGTDYIDDGATALDNIDGVITASIVVAGDVVDINTVDAYIITYNVSDAAGNPALQVTRTVSVTADVTAPVITLEGASAVTMQAGSIYIELGATATDNVDG